MKATAQVTKRVDFSLADKIKQQNKQNKLPFKRALMIWMPFAFSAFIAAITLAPTFYGISDPMPLGLVPFICFLPLAFFHSANATFIEISALEARIQKLENKGAEQGAAANP